MLLDTYKMDYVLRPLEDTQNYIKHKLVILQHRVGLSTSIYFNDTPVLLIKGTYQVQSGCLVQLATKRQSWRWKIIFENIPEEVRGFF
jgi:hypothetical protein